MPNWVYNTLTVTKGDPREVFEFVHSAESIFDFNKIIPMPRELDIESSTKSQLAILCAQNDGIGEWAKYGWVQKAGYKTPKELCTACKYDYDEMVRFGEQLLENERKYGARTWYDWCWNEWGTKWNACDAKYSTKDTRTLGFDTAWSPPVPVFEALAKQFPNHEIIVSVEYQNWVEFTLKDGHLTWEKKYISQEIYDAMPSDSPKGEMLELDSSTSTEGAASSGNGQPWVAGELCSEAWLSSRDTTSQAKEDCDNENRSQ